MLLELAEDWELRMRRVLPVLAVGGGAGMRGSSGVASAPVAGLAELRRVPSPRAAVTAAAPARASQPRGGGVVDAAAARRNVPLAPRGGCVGERRAAALAATATVIVRRRRCQAV